MTQFWSNCVAAPVRHNGNNKTGSQKKCTHLFVLLLRLPLVAISVAVLLFALHHIANSAVCVLLLACLLSPACTPCRPRLECASSSHRHVTAPLSPRALAYTAALLHACPELSSRAAFSAAFACVVRQDPNGVIISSAMSCANPEPPFEHCQR